MTQADFEDILRQLEGLRGDVRELRADFRSMDSRNVSTFDYITSVTSQIVAQNKLPVIIQLAGFFIVIAIVLFSFFDWGIGGQYLGFTIKRDKGAKAIPLVP